MLLPTGTVTFLFTDIEGSTRTWETYPEEMRRALSRHDAILRQAIEENKGYIVKTTGDGFVVAFSTATDALNTALFAQHHLLAEIWPEPLTIRVRMGLHTGAAELREGDYFGSSLNRTARLMAAGSGGQVLVSSATQELCRDSLPPSVLLHSLGEHRLKDLNRSETVYQVQHPDLPSSFVALKTLDSLPNNLPQQLTSFIGREKELTEIRGLLSKTRLLTMMGSGGCGKTRLSLQVAADVLEDYPDGVWVAELAPVLEPAHLPQTVAQILSAREQPGQTILQTLTESCKEKRLLLVLDNCEHLLLACAQFATAMLRACPNVRILATSRERLAVAGELTYRVPSLTLPDLHQTATPQSLSVFESVNLFIERALLHKPDFVVTNQNAPALAELCHHLDGIPLAIELAAARIRSLSVEDVNSRLDSRFRLLTGGDRSALPRQQTLRALVDWSYDLLTESEKTVLARLSVFAGGWTLAAAEYVCGFAPVEDWEVLDLLTSLLDKSLVLTEEYEGAARYRLLETIRQYAVEKLEAAGETRTVQERHGTHFLALAEEAELHLHGPDQGRWLALLEREHENLRAVLARYAIQPDGAEAGLRLAVALYQFWLIRGHLTEGRKQLSFAAARAPSRSILVARALNGEGLLARFQGDLVVSDSLLQEGLDLARHWEDKSLTCNLMLNLAVNEDSRGNTVQARELYEACLVNFREIGNTRSLGHTLQSLGNLVGHQGDFALAFSLYEEALSLYQELGDKRMMAHVKLNTGIVATVQGDNVLAKSSLEESLAVFRDIGDNTPIPTVLLGLGNLAIPDDLALARSLFEEGLPLCHELGDKRMAAFLQMGLGNVAYLQDNYVLSKSMYEESLKAFQNMGDRLRISLVLSNLGVILVKIGDYLLARARLEESLSLYQDGDNREISSTLDSLAEIMRVESEAEKAVVLWGASDALRKNVTAIEQAEYEQRLEKARVALGEEAFTVAWEKGGSMSWQQAVDYAL